MVFSRSYIKTLFLDFEILQVKVRPPISNMSNSTAYGVFISQCIRIFRICNKTNLFHSRIKKLISCFLNLNYSEKIVRGKLVSMYRRYLVGEKFPDIGTAESLFV